MNILIDCRLLSYHPTGIDRYIREILEIFSKNLKTNYSITLLAYSSQRELVGESLHKYEVIFVKLSPFNPIHVLLLSLYLCLANKYYDIYYWTIYSGVYFKKRKSKHIVMVHDLMFRLIPRYFSESLVINFIKKSILDFVVKYTLSNADIVLSNSKTSYMDIYNFYNIKSITIPLGLSLKPTNETVHPGIQYITSQYEFQYYLYVGNNRKQKNLNFLIETFLDSKSEKKLIIAGCEVNNNSNRIINIQSFSDQDLITLYKNSFCFVFPSLYEGFGLPIIESANYAQKILSSENGSLIEFDFLGINYFNPKSKIQLGNYFNNESLIIDVKGNLKISDIYSWSHYDIILHKTLSKIIDDKY